MPRQTSLRRTGVAVEDSVALKDGSGMEDGIIRKYLTDIWGDETDITNKAAQKSYSFDVDPKWNIEHMRIVAFLNNYDTTNPLNCPVFNTGEKRLAGLTAIHAIADQQAEKASLKLEDNHLIASGGYQIAGVYDMAGRQVSENNLGKGIYLVKLSNGKDTQTVKFNIR